MYSYWLCSHFIYINSLAKAIYSLFLKYVYFCHLHTYSLLGTIITCTTAGQLSLICCEFFLLNIWIEVLSDFPEIHYLHSSKKHVNMWKSWHTYVQGIPHLTLNKPMQEKISWHTWDQYWEVRNHWNIHKIKEITKTRLD